MLPETFESRERIGASALQGGNLLDRGGLAQWLRVGQSLKTSGRVVPRIASIAYRIPQDPRSRDRLSFPPFNSQTRQRAWQRRRALQNNHAWFDKLTMRESGALQNAASLMVSLSNHAPRTCTPWSIEPLLRVPRPCTASRRPYRPGWPLTARPHPRGRRRRHWSGRRG